MPLVPKNPLESAAHDIYHSRLCSPLTVARARGVNHDPVQRIFHVSELPGAPEIRDRLGEVLALIPKIDRRFSFEDRGDGNYEMKFNPAIAP
ncbi:MAG: hypothetical protein WCT36_03585 [Candidatus Gracilibacteria bacterium]|jgi:hypothetical protein